MAWGALKDKLAGEFTSGDANVGALLCHGVAAAWSQDVLDNVAGKLPAHGVWGGCSGLLASEIVAEALDGLANPLTRACIGVLRDALLGAEERDNLPKLLPGELLIGR